MGNGRHYPHTSVGCGGPHGNTGGDDYGLPDEPYGGGSDSLSSSELRRQHRHEQCSQLHGKLE